MGEGSRGRTGAGGGEGDGRGGATQTNQPTNQLTNPSISGERRTLYDGERAGRGIWSGGGWFCMLMHVCIHSHACASLCERYVYVWAVRERMMYGRWRSGVKRGDRVKRRGVDSIKF